MRLHINTDTKIARSRTPSIRTETPYSGRARPKNRLHINTDTSIGHNNRPIDANAPPNTHRNPVFHAPNRAMQRAYEHRPPTPPRPPHTMPPDVDSDDDAPPPRAAAMPRVRPRPRAGHDVSASAATTAASTTLDDDLPRPRLGHDEPIIEVIDKFLCLGAFEHTSKEDVLLACGIRTVMNVRGERSERGGRTSASGTGRAATGRALGEGLGTWGGRALAWRSAERRKRRRARMAGTRSRGARRRFGDDVGTVDAIGGQKSAGD